jgi:hypothetical protein
LSGCGPFDCVRAGRGSAGAFLRGLVLGQTDLPWIERSPSVVAHLGLSSRPSSRVQPPPIGRYPWTDAGFRRGLAA